MQTANIILDIGGDAGNQIPKSGITAAEIAVLIAIHGEAAVHDIEPAGSIDRSNRDELSRLHQVYGHAKDGEDRSIVGTLFPGAAARVFATLDELNLPDEFFKATERAAPAPVVETTVAEDATFDIGVEQKPDPLDHDGDGKKGGSKKGAASTRAKGAARKRSTARKPAKKR